MLGDQGLVVDRGDEELVLEALGVAEAQRLGAVRALRIHSGVRQPPAPEVERVRRGNTPDDPVDHPGAGPPHRQARVLEEREVRARVPGLVGVEEVVDGRVVLVDRLLHEPEAERAGVEVDVLLGVGGDRGDVVDAVELHASDPTPGSWALSTALLMVDRAHRRWWVATAYSSAARADSMSSVAITSLTPPNVV